MNELTKHTLRRTLTGINLLVVGSCRLERWRKGALCGWKKFAMAQTLGLWFTCPVQICSVGSRWGTLASWEEAITYNEWV